MRFFLRCAIAHAHTYPLAIDIRTFVQHAHEKLLNSLCFRHLAPRPKIYRNKTTRKKRELFNFPPPMPDANSIEMFHRFIGARKSFQLVLNVHSFDL